MHASKRIPALRFGFCALNLPNAMRFYLTFLASRGETAGFTVNAQADPG
jgi:hypothetical protein